MSVFDWNGDYEVQIDSVDQQHKRLVALINALGDRLAGEALSFEEAKAMIAEAADYAKYHFSEEEKLMRLFSVDLRHVESHYDQHTKFLAYASSIFMDLREESYVAACRQLLDFLISWLGLHILTQDRVMALQIKAIEADMKPAAAYEKYDSEDKQREPLVRILLNLVNAMFTRSHELQMLKDSLEVKVAERTEALRKVNEYLKDLSFTDTLTGLPNRRQAMRYLDRLWGEAQERDLALCCMMIDADHFKSVNDTYGHDAGDKLLCSVASCLRDAVRADDLVARLGGDEFLIVLPGTLLRDAFMLARRVHDNVNKLCVEFAPGESWKGSVSIGLASRHPDMPDQNTLVKQADKALYKAKSAGKNCIRM